MLFSFSINRENPGVDFEAPLHVRNIIHDVGDHTKANPMFQSPFMAGLLSIPPYPLL